MKSSIETPIRQFLIFFPCGTLVPVEIIFIFINQQRLGCVSVLSHVIFYKTHVYLDNGLIISTSFNLTAHHVGVMLSPSRVVNSHLLITGTFKTTLTWAEGKVSLGSEKVQLFTIWEADVSLLSKSSARSRANKTKHKLF